MDRTYKSVPDMMRGISLDNDLIRAVDKKIIRYRIRGPLGGWSMMTRMEKAGVIWRVGMSPITMTILATGIFCVGLAGLIAHGEWMRIRPE